MGNNVSKVLRDQYLKLCSLKVDDVKQHKLLEQLLKNLKQTEKALVTELAPDPVRLASYDQRVLESCSDKSDKELVDNLKLIGEYPRIKLAADIIDYAFKQISNNRKIPDLLKLIIMSLKPSLFRLALEDYRTLVSKTNPIVQTIEILVSYVPLWKDEQKANFPTFKKLVSILDFVDTSSDQLAKKLEDTVLPIAQIWENQQKRSLIFEKRLVEREASSATTRTSQLFIAEILRQIKLRYQLEPFLCDFLEQHWSRLLTLEFVRKDQTAFIGSIEFFVRLINSLMEIKSKKALNQLIDELPTLKKGLLAGLNKLAVSELEANEFLTEVESRHLNIIQQNSQLPNDEETVSEEKAPVAPQPAQQQEKAPSIDEDDLIRLKPTDFYSTGIDASTENEEQHNTNSNNSSHSDSTDYTDATSNDLDAKSFLEAIEDIITTDKLCEESPSVTHEELFAKMQKELNQLIYPGQTSYESEDIKSYISLNDWYSVKGELELHKLIYIDESTGQHIFANQMAQKSHSFEVNEISQLYTDGQLEKFVAPNIVTPAIKKSLILFKEFLAKRKKRSSQDSAEVIDILQQDTISSEAISEESSTELESQQPNQFKEATQRPITADISSITVGSWISYKLNNREIKCKLAARIVSKDVYIFVDRKGLKILEQTSQELTDKLNSGKIILVESENSGRLESVIAKTRNLKS